MGKKILFLSFVDVNHPYGAHIRPFYLGKNLCSLGYRVFNVCIRGEKKSDFPTYIELNSLGSRNFLKRYLPLFIKFSKIINDIEPDVVYAHSQVLCLIAGFFKKRISLGIPLLLDMHGSWGIEEVHSKIYPLRTRSLSKNR